MRGLHPLMVFMHNRMTAQEKQSLFAAFGEIRLRKKTTAPLRRVIFTKSKTPTARRGYFFVRFLLCIRLFRRILNHYRLHDLLSVPLFQVGAEFLFVNAEQRQGHGQR